MKMLSYAPQLSRRKPNRGVSVNQLSFCKAHLLVGYVKSLTPVHSFPLIFDCILPFCQLMVKVVAAYFCCCVIVGF